MQAAQGAVGLHLGDDAIDEGEQVVLTLAHQHADFAVGKGGGEQAVNTLAPQMTMVSTNGRMAAESIQCIIFLILFCFWK